MTRRVDLAVTNLATTPAQEDQLVDALTALVVKAYPDADVDAITGNNKPPKPKHTARPPHPLTMAGK